ncbi:AraC family transcriptional regulator [Pedobacter sp. AW31-3R]|uniref:AraC family transcriptional regulator n=1 Tax=Pedobacter sp. AW31-3R TaxID=3445781 RepID=UPI003F9ECE31
MMYQEKQFESIVILEHHVEHVDKVLHLHNFYEFIFVKSGSGLHHINGETTAFGKGNLFFISPSDQHSLEIDVSSVLISIRFTEQAKARIKAMQKAWKGDFSGLKKGRSPLNIKVTFSERDVEIVEGIFQLFSLLKEEILSNESIIYVQLIALVSLIERNLSYGNSNVVNLYTLPSQKKSVEFLLAYINRHISNPEMLTATHLAEEHGLSVHYIGLYFKQHAGITLQGYINKCRQTIIARKLLSSELSVTQLAADFRFTDVSHFNKSFKKYWGVSPAKYRSGKQPVQ